MDTAEVELWADLHAAPDDAGRHAVREQLILRYMPLVRYVAFRIAARVGDHADREDLVSYGMFGLIEAIDRFDPNHGVKFETFATARIQGSILDELRALDWAPRSLRAKSRQIVQTRERLEQVHHRYITDQEIAAELGWSVREVQTVYAETLTSYTVPLNEPEREDDEGSRDRTNVIPDLSNDDPELNAQVATIRRLLAEAIPRLPHRERAVATMYWRGGSCPECVMAGSLDVGTPAITDASQHEQSSDCVTDTTSICERCQGTRVVAALTLGEIGQVLGISESWACQLYTNAAELLRRDLW